MSHVLHLVCGRPSNALLFPPALLRRPGRGREAEDSPALRLALGAVACALAGARRETQAHRDSEAAGASSELASLGQSPVEVEPTQAGPGGYRIGHSEGAPRMLLGHAWSTVADTCLAQSTISGGEDEAEQPRPDSGDQGSRGVLPFLVLHASAAAASARQQSARPWLTIAQVRTLPPLRIPPGHVHSLAALLRGPPWAPIVCRLHLEGKPSHSRLRGLLGLGQPLGPAGEGAGHGVPACLNRPFCCVAVAPW